MIVTYFMPTISNWAFVISAFLFMLTAIRRLPTFHWGEVNKAARLFGTATHVPTEVGYSDLNALKF